MNRNNINPKSDIIEGCKLKHDLNLNGINIEYRKEDGFVNATSMCKAGKKEFYDWKRLESTKELIEALEGEIGISKTELMESNMGRYGKKIMEDNLDKQIEFRKEDGFVNATAMCKAGKKEFKNWKCLESTKKLIEALEGEIRISKTELMESNKGRYGKKILDLENETGITKSKLMDSKKGNTSKYSKGSWIHPILATNLAQWISPKFGMKVCIWIDEWKKLNNNKNIYDNEINNLKPTYQNQKEKEIQIKLQQELGGEIEVETDSGFIDLLTDTEIIEIKQGKNWKHAMGQVLSYSIDYKDHIKRIHLFDMEYDSHINKTCLVYNVKVTYET
jgi:hypothetical protein